MSDKLKRLDVLEEMFYRQLLVKGSEEERDYYWLSRGRQGELEMLELLKKKLQGCARLYHDVQLDFNGHTQVDILVIWDYFWWVIEVKNIAGVFEIRDNNCFIGSKSTRNNYIVRMRNRIRIIEELANAINPKIKVEGSFILINPQGELVADQLPEFPILTVNQIDRHLDQVIDHQNPCYHHEQTDKYHYYLNKFAKSYPEKIPVMDFSDWAKSRKGVRCPNCQEYCIEKTTNSVFCPKCKTKLLKRDLVFNVS